MFLKSFIVPLSSLWLGVTAIPAGPGYYGPNMTKLPPVDGDTVFAQAFGLIETYDASNWLSKFDVQAVSKSLLFYTSFTNQS